MASNYTENYGLCQWEATDQILRTEFNKDNAKIDATLKGLADKVLISESVLAKLGNCKIEHRTYTGTGAYGNASPTRITFAQAPLLFVILGSNGSSAFGSRLMTVYTVVDSGVSTGKAAWSGNQVALTHTVFDYLQMNQSGTVYQVFGFSIPE